MNSLRRAFLFLVSALVCILVGQTYGFGQTSPTSMTLFYNGLPIHSFIQGDCYDFDFGPSAAGMTLDISWNQDDGEPQYIYGWPTLDGSGQASNICTDFLTPIGQLKFLEVRNSAGGPWAPINYTITVMPQVTGAYYTTSAGFAGVDAFEFHVDAVVSRNVRIRYSWSIYTQDTEIPVDGEGNYNSGLVDHYVWAGLYVVTLVQDAAAQPDNWRAINAQYFLHPPQPTSFWMDKASIVAGGPNGTNTFHMFAANGSDVTLDDWYSLNGSERFDYSFPHLNADGGPSWQGRSSDISASKCTAPGVRTILRVRNSLNVYWKDVGEKMISITGAGVPTLAGLSSVSAAAGQAVTVTITGQNLCGSSLTTNYPGLTFSNIVNPDWSDGTSMTAVFQVAANAAAGNALVTLHTRHEIAVNFYFGVQGGSPPTLVGISPASALPGSTIVVTMTGTNLISPTLSTTWSGLSFSNVVPSGNGTSLTLAFTVSTNAALGNPAIKVTTPSGMVTTTLFSIAAAGPALSREYIYLGDRVIASESP